MMAFEFVRGNESSGIIDLETVEIPMDIPVIQTTQDKPELPKPKLPAPITDVDIAHSASSSLDEKPIRVIYNLPVGFILR